MSAKHALLGLLVDRPAHPYQLADRLKDRLGPTWAINSGQLYQTMKRLERDGLVERVVSAEDPENEERHVFRLTESGLGEFERWFDEATIETRLSRRPLLVMVTLAGPERLQAALEKIDAYELACLGRVNDLRNELEKISVGSAAAPIATDVLRRLNLSADVFQLEAEMRWARHAHEMVSRLQRQEAIWPSTSARSSPTDETRKHLRKELFGQMAARHLRPASDERGEDHDD